MLDQSAPPQPLSSPQPPSGPQPTNFQPGNPATVGQKKNNTIWWVLGGCGCLTFLVIPALIIMTVAFVNPANRINESQENFYKNEIRKTGAAIAVCIEAEAAKKTDSVKIYSIEKCANKDYLYDNRYTEIEIYSPVRVISSSANDKICAYAGYYDYEKDEDLVVSWDSDKQTVLSAGQGTKTCTDLATSQTATKSATTSAN